MKRPGLLATILVGFALMVILGPSLAISELHTTSSVGLSMPHDEELYLHFSRLPQNAETNAEDEDYGILEPPGGRIGHWFEDFPWLGVISETSLVQGDESNLETSIDADTDFDPLSSFILFRYPNWRFEPFVAIGPTLIISDLDNGKMGSLHHLFMGIYYSF